MGVLSSLLLLIVGLAILVLGADWLINSCVKVSRIFKLAPLFIGLVFVAFGTSVPEAGVSIMAVFRNQQAIALGNIIGSNIFNIGLILGLCAFLRPLSVNKKIFKREIPLMLFSVVSLYILSLDLIISRIDGLVFILSFIFFCFVSYSGAKKTFDYSEIEDFKLKKIFKKINSKLLIFLIILFSIAGIAVGADLMLKGGVSLAKIFGISPWIIGIIVFAAGTSLPELAASLTAAFKKAHSISIGNIVGSNIFNILLVLGIVSLIRPIELNPSILNFELPILLIFSFCLFIVMRTEYKISRLEGLVMLSGYITFIIILITNRI